MSGSWLAPRHSSTRLARVTDDSTETPWAVTAQFREFLNDAAASYGALTSGLGFMRRTFEQVAELTNMGPDDVVHLTTGDMPTERPSDAFGVWTHSRIIESCGPNSAVARQLGHWWVSHVYAMWEHGFRPRLAKARGIALDDVTDPLMGDLRRLRHDVLHHGGIATAEWTGRCQRLRWFTTGDDIFITGRMIYEFMEGFGLAHPAP